MRFRAESETESLSEKKGKDEPNEENRNFADKEQEPLDRSHRRNRIKLLALSATLQLELVQ